MNVANISFPRYSHLYFLLHISFAFVYLLLIFNVCSIKFIVFCLFFKLLSGFLLNSLVLTCTNSLYLLLTLNFMFHHVYSILFFLHVALLSNFIPEILKPKDSFGEFDNFFLDLQKVQEIIRKHHQTFLQIVWNDILKCNIAQWQIIIMYITYGEVFGGTPNIFMFWLFPENGSISERTVNRALMVHIQPYKILN